ncbi:probable 3',5'-cyclic phosphodiesterase pde-5 [Oppia nitens]|uniref:probable 3',5'-cyclic phosphodiesterase pde-5 n=1 Tax=Oppia nitens TaxID=1686743 RepID=UPI0023DBEEBF|nr:probable 3',5'-cyclic phosphodiesterase pde-5 [Oppia nitens]
MNLEQLETILQQNPELLEDYVMKNIDSSVLEKWLIRKTQLNSNKRLSKANVKYRNNHVVDNKNKSKLLADLQQNLQQNHNSEPNKLTVLTQLAGTVAFATGADQYNVFMFDHISNEMRRITDNNNIENQVNGFAKEDQKQNLVEFVNKSKTTVLWTVKQFDCRFKDGSPYMPTKACYVMAIPITLRDNSVLGVVELYKLNPMDPFANNIEEIVQSYIIWASIALHYAELYSNISRQRKLNTFLLTVVKSIFQDMISMDTVIGKIMDYAKTLVNADRTALYLVDSNDRQLYPYIMKVKHHNNNNNNNNNTNNTNNKTNNTTADDIDNNDETIVVNTNNNNKKMTRFPIGSGIAGIVAKTGRPLNIADVYEDDRFDRDVDQIIGDGGDDDGGYPINNLLCMPVMNKNKVIGVVQMVNKLNGNFTKVDEENFGTFATYCGLALDHARLYEKIRKSEQKNKVALEVLSYHNLSNDEELADTRLNIQSFQAPDVTNQSFSPYNLSNDHKLLTTIKIFEQINGINKIDNDDLYRFTLSVRKNYRRVPYHNWTHGFSVAQSLYTFIHDCQQFTAMEKLAFFVSGLCHDLDHRGTTNQFLIHSSAPLAAIYTTSPLEHHHYNQTIHILQQNGHNILKSLPGHEYKKMLALIKHCILATDLALFFPNKSKLEKLLITGLFDWNNSEHKLLLEAVAMTAADLNSTARPWSEAIEQVRELFEEFYAQGDIEKGLGRKPIPLMDRDKLDEQPASQVDFLANISIPCFQMLTQLLPNANSYLNHCIQNLKLWKDRVERDRKLKERKALMAAINEEESTVGGHKRDIGRRVRPVTKGRLERTRSLLH